MNNDDTRDVMTANDSTLGVMMVQQDDSQEIYDLNVPREILSSSDSVTGLHSHNQPDSDISLSISEDVHITVQPCDQYRLFTRNDFAFTVREIMKNIKHENTDNNVSDEDLQGISDRIYKLRRTARRKSVKWKMLSGLGDITTLILPILTVFLDVEDPDDLETIKIFTWVTVSVRVLMTVFKIGDKGVLYNYIALRYSQHMSKIDSLRLTTECDHEDRAKLLVGILFEIENLGIVINGESSAFMGVI